jgi:hypothetical protein
MNCRVCGTEDKDKPQIFKTTDACCERHRKIIAEEPGIEPTYQEWVTMDRKLYMSWEGQWQAPSGVEKERRTTSKGI